MNLLPWLLLLAAPAGAPAAGPAAGPATGPATGPAVVSEAGLQIHTVETEYQTGPNQIRVLLPDRYDPTRAHRVLYVLPVGTGKGSALRLFRELDVHNRYNLVLVELTFSTTPWFGDHASDPNVRQESYLRDFVVPFIEQRYSTMKSPEGRLLVGFSKSGWGAVALILRNPDVFGYAASWDAPYMLPDFHYGMDKVFGDLEHLKKYRPDLLVPRAEESFRRKTRLVIGGEDKWGKLIPTPSGGSHTVEFHALLDAHHVRHVYRSDLNTPHTWGKAWIGPMVEELMKLTERQPD